MKQIEALSKDMRSCTICEGLPLGPKPLFRLGTRARILIAGQAPGRITHHKGRPFDDVSGDRLREWLGIDRDTFYHDERLAILPMGLCFPGTGSGGDLPPRSECAAAWRARALACLVDLELTLVIGRYAIDWHLPDLKRKSVTEAVLAGRNAMGATLVLPHPSPRNMRWLKRNDWFEAEVLPRLRARVAALLNAA